MTDPYGDTDLVALYDIDNPAGADHQHYRALADRLGARRIVDLGCGTGLLTRALARPGRSVTGIDPSPTMIGWAGEQPHSREVRWIVGDASSIPATGDVDLVLCTGNTIMHLGPDELTQALFRTVGALRPGGVVSFECRNAADREWERWTREATVGTRDTSLGRLTEWIEVTDVTGGRMTFDAHNVVPGGDDRVYTNALFFREVDEYRAVLGDAGFEDIEVDGGWTAEPPTPTATVFVFRARRPGEPVHPGRANGSLPLRRCGPGRDPVPNERG